MGIFTAIRLKFPKISLEMDLRARMLATFIPVVVTTLLVTGYLTYQIAIGFLKTPLENEGRIHLASLIREVEQFLEECRKDLLIITQEQPDPANLSRYLAKIRSVRGLDYRMLAFISLTNDDHAIFIARGDAMERIPANMAGEIKPNLFTIYDDIKGLEVGETWISKIRRMEYPFPIVENPNLKLVSSGILFANTCVSPDGRALGYLVLSVEIQNLKEVFSEYHVRDSKIPPLPPEGVDTRYSYFFDTTGWILFDSGNAADPNSVPSTDLARYGYGGILGSPENPAGFKPDLSFESFWAMIRQVREGRYGATKTANLEIQSPTFKEHFCSYGPVLFRPSVGKPPVVYGGVAFVDRSRLTQAVVYKQMNVMLFISLGAILLLCLVILSLAHYITRPLVALTRAVNSMQQSGRLEHLEIPRASHEIKLLKDSMNAMITKIREQFDLIALSERLREETALRVTAEIENEDGPAPADSSRIQISGIIGNSKRVEGLRAEILKAAKVDADVLIIGETGTGKQLTAEAIHQYGRRFQNPLVCINCGELDENLLLDSLFGHVKGAFTEAKGERKGAFLEASGGILFLDEIQTASSSVQQALLRAISQRIVRPLGSDKDMEVDVRVIAASNRDLGELVTKGRFRQDLYFRLKVITIYTPPLREIKEDIPLLVRHYFDLAKKQSHKEKLRMSKGTLERLKNYEWPGNVRELTNCLTRAVVMAEGRIIQVEDVLLETGGVSTTTQPAKLFPDRPPISEPGHQASHDPLFLVAEKDLAAPPAFALHERQKKAYTLIVQKGSISRLEYQWAVGGNIPSRTAIYDLKSMVKKGLIEKTGSGPSTRYVLAESHRKQKQSS